MSRRSTTPEELRSWFLTVCAVGILVIVVLRADGDINPYVIVLLGGMMGLGYLRFGGDDTPAERQPPEPTELPDLPVDPMPTKRRGPPTDGPLHRLTYGVRH